MNNTIVTLKQKEGRYLKQGGLWIFDNEIDTIQGTFKNGEVVTVHDFDGYPMGKGYINQNSKIRIRMLTRNVDEVIDDEFFFQRVKNAWEYRKTVLASEDLNACRIIFGEADFIPGLVADKYNDIIVIQALTLGIIPFLTVITSSIAKVLKDDGIEIRGFYERSDVNERKKEGLQFSKGFLPFVDLDTREEKGFEFDTDIEIVENGVHYMVDVVNGQKTGFFLDQKYNRLAMQRICKDKSVLDCFTHMGTFALNAGLGGAKRVEGLDISEFAIHQAKENAKRNHLDDRVKFRVANVLDELPLLVSKGVKYDVVILDPPAFTKSREATKNAINGYRQINIQGLKLVENGGYFATCSCSHFMTQELFTKTIREAANSAHKRLRQIEFKTQAPDHPILWAADESYYLKFYIFQVVDEK